MALRIGMLLDKPFPPDPRVANEARSLAAAGHDVHLLALRFDEATPAREIWEGVTLHRILIHRQFYKKASALCLAFPAYFTFFRKHLRRFLEEQGIEVLHVHDLPLLSVGLEEGRRRGIPVVADLHENYPAAVETYAYANRLPGRLFISPDRWRAYERRYLARADRVIVVVEEAAERLAELKVPAERIAVISNTVQVDEFEGFPRDEEILRRFGSGFVLAYLGGFERHRGLETVLDALQRLLRFDHSYRLLLVGDGAHRAALEDQAAGLGIEDQVAFEGWQPFHCFPSYVAASSICLIPHLKSGHTDTTIPHKLFHYMLLARAVVATDCRPLKRILDQTGAGLVYPSGDPEALAAQIRQLQDSGLRRQLGENGRRAVLTEHNWQRSSAQLLRMYESLAN